MICVARINDGFRLGWEIETITLDGSGTAFLSDDEAIHLHRHITNIFNQASGHQMPGMGDALTAMTNSIYTVEHLREALER